VTRQITTEWEHLAVGEVREGQFLRRVGLKIVGADVSDVGGTPGPQGETGPQGPQGEQGPQGPAGQDGAQGPAGADGVDGAQGLQGPQGLPGNDGAQGVKGDKGDQGIQGIQGIQGPAGADGAGAPIKAGVVNLGAGATAAVTFTTPFASTPFVVVTSQIANTDTSCTYSAHNVTANGFTIRGAGNPAGNVAWIATTAGNT
jgi:hypothetical protein